MKQAFIFISVLPNRWSTALHCSPFRLSFFFVFGLASSVWLKVEYLKRKLKFLLFFICEEVLKVFAGKVFEIHSSRPLFFLFFFIFQRILCILHREDSCIERLKILIDYRRLQDSSRNFRAPFSNFSYHWFWVSLPSSFIYNSNSTS